MFTGHFEFRHLWSFPVKASLWYFPYLDVDTIFGDLRRRNIVVRNTIFIKAPSSVVSVYVT
jgi:hypothetical protein